MEGGRKTGQHLCSQHINQQEEGDVGQVASETVFIHLPLSYPNPSTRRGTPSVGCWELTELMAAT